jgi:hypothetical protein
MCMLVCVCVSAKVLLPCFCDAVLPGVGGGSGKQQTPNVCVCDAALDFRAQLGSTGMFIASLSCQQKAL